MSPRRNHTVVAIALGASSVFGTVGVSDAQPDFAGVSVPQNEFVDLPDEFRDATEWAIELFDAADLDLAPLRFVHHIDAKADAPDQAGRTRCDGVPASHRVVDDVHVIDICAAEMTAPTQVIILHEIAHAWISEEVTAERRAQFQELRGWEVWRDYESAPWHDNGTEQAAEIVVWGLIDRPLRMVRIEQNSCDELAAGYRTLVGAAPLHGLRDAC